MSNNLKALEAKYKEMGAEIDRLKLKHPKQGDWCKFWDDDPDVYIIAKYFCSEVEHDPYYDYVAYEPNDDIYRTTPYKNCKPIEFLEIHDTSSSESIPIGDGRSILAYNKNYPGDTPKVLRHHDIMWYNVGKYAVLPDEV